MITVIPAIDLIDGNCVRLTQGDFNTKKIYYQNPVDAAKLIEGCGISHLHIVDLDNAKEGEIISLKAVENIAKATTLHIDYGGGVKTDSDMKSVFNAGASQVNIGSLAVKEPEKMTEWLQKYGDKLILSADVRNQLIALSGWKDDTDIPLNDFIQQFTDKGLKYVTSTDISLDGRLTGPAFEMYKKLKSDFPELNICASGGISKIEDIDRLNDMNIERVIVGKAIYEGIITFGDLLKYSPNA